MCGYGAQEGELCFPEDREVNLVELALATNIPKGCAETAVRGESQAGRGVGLGWRAHGAQLGEGVGGAR